MEKHIVLKNYPVLYFFANIIDPNGEHQVDDIVKAICSKFELDTPNKESGFNSLNNNLIKFVETDHVRELYFELPIYGFVRVYKEYRTMKYKEHTMEFNHSSELQVNTNHTERKRGWDEDKMSNFKNVMFTLYDKDDSKSISWTDIFDACWLVFDKGSQDNARNTFEKSIELMIRKLEKNYDMDEYPKLFNKYAYFIKEKWDDYLWSKYEENTIQNTDFWLGLQEFINRNIDSWLEGYDRHVVSCRIYTDEHESIVNQFSTLNERIALPYNIITLWDLIVTQGEENSYKHLSTVC